MGEVITTRVQYSGPPRRARNLEERLMVRFPDAWRAVAAAGQRLLRPRSRLRRAFLRRQMISGWAAASRQDFQLMMVRYAPDVEFQFAADFEALGLGDKARGHDGMLRVIDAFQEAWGQVEFRPAMQLDFGDRFLGLGQIGVAGTASGLEIEREFAQLLTIRGGVVAYEQEFLSWDEGLRAARLDPDAIDLPARTKTGPSVSGGA